jgi:aldose sugar dehydrogenase
MKFPSISMLSAVVLFLSTVACAETKSPSSPELSSPEPGHYFSVPIKAGDVMETDDMNIRLDLVVEGLGIPWGMAFLPDGSVLITERQGNLRIVRNGVLQEEPIAGVPEVFAVGQGGLLDVVLHPDYDNNGWIYLTYSEPADNAGHTSIMRAKLQDNTLVNQEVIFRSSPSSDRRHHFGSRIVFDNDGYMFFTIGDRGVMGNSQELNNYAGKTFRLYDDGRIPADNPFVGRADALDEIWTYGNRNQQGIALHPETGEVWSHEHGPRGGDELNVMRAGLNYGWPTISYGINYNGTIITELTEKEGMEQPLHEWTPSIAPSGMVFVTSDRYPAWQGDLLIGSLSFQYLHRSVLDGETVVKDERIAPAIGRVRDVRQAPDGFIYFSTDNGRIYRVLPEN